MGFTDWINKLFNKEGRTFNGENTVTEDSMPYLYDWFWTASLGKPRKVDVVELRQYAKSCWVQMIKSTIKKQMMNTEWSIINSDEEDETDYSKDIEECETFLKNPNRNCETFWELWGAFIDDVLDGDCGVAFKGRNARGKLVELFAYDGFRFLVDVDPYGIINGWYQYSYRYPQNSPKYFKRDELIYGKVGVRTEEYPYGWSPLQSIMQEVELMIQSTRYNKEWFKNNAIPDGIVKLSMPKDDMERFKQDWKNDIKGKPHKLIFHNSDVDFTPLKLTNKDMEWLDGQKWYFHIVFGAYGVSPAEAGFYEDVNRSAQEGQERTTVKNAIKPYLKLISDKINREIIPELVDHDKIKFKWDLEDDQREQEKHKQVMDKLSRRVYTINEVRAMEGLDPLEGGDEIVSQDNNNNNFNNNSDNSKNEDKNKEKSEKSYEYKYKFLQYLKDGKFRQ